MTVAPISAGKTDTTQSIGDHPAHHDALAAGVNEHETRIAVIAEAPRIVEDPRYASLASGSDWTPAIQAALNAGLGDVLISQPHDIAGRVLVGSAQLLGVGDGGGTVTKAAAKLRCTAAGAGVDFGPGDFSTNGGESGGFMVDGNNVATAPMVVKEGGRLYKQISVMNSAQDNLRVQQVQNSTFVQITTSRAVRDNLILDQGCGGIKFDNYEGYGAGRNGIRLDQTAGGGGYAQPSQIQFIGGRTEFSKGAELENIHSDQVKFQDFHFNPDSSYNDPALAACNLRVNAFWTQFVDCYWPTSCGYALFVDGAFVDVDSGWFQTAVAGIHAPSAGLVRIGRPPFLFGLPLLSATTSRARLNQPGLDLERTTHQPLNTIPWWAGPADNLNFVNLSTGAVAIGGYRFSSGAQNDFVSFDVSFAPGDYAFYLLNSKGPDRGKYQLNVDGVDVGDPLDGYNATVADSQLSQVASGGGGLTYTVSGAGKRVRVKLTMATKNASSSAYYGAIHGLLVWRFA